MKLAYLRRLKRIIRRKMNGDKEDAPSIRTIWRTHYGSLPMKHVFGNWTWGNTYESAHQQKTTVINIKTTWDIQRTIGTNKSWEKEEQPLKPSILSHAKACTINSSTRVKQIIMVNTWMVMSRQSTYKLTLCLEARTNQGYQELEVLDN